MVMMPPANQDTEIDEKPNLSMIPSPTRPLHEEMAARFLNDLQQNIQRQHVQEQEHTWIVQDDEQGTTISSRNRYGNCTIHCLLVLFTNPLSMVALWLQR
jgi:hypothetical protein